MLKHFGCIEYNILLYYLSSKKEVNNMNAKPTTVVNDLAICGHCDKGLYWIEKYGIWIHFDNDKQTCPN